MKDLSLQVFSVNFIIIVLLFLTNLKCERLLENEPITIVLAFSGLGQNHLRIEQTRTLQQLVKEGVTTQKGLKAVFPSTVASNYHTFSTGLFVKYHGVTGPMNFDIDSNEVKDSSEFYQASSSILPVWVLNELAGGTSGCLMWPGTEYMYLNTSCTYHAPFSGAMTHLDKARLILKWVFNKEKPVNLVMAYSHMPSFLSMYFNPHSTEELAEIEKIDDMIEFLLQRLRKSRVYKRINLIVLGEQAYISVQRRAIIELNTILKPDTYKAYGTSPVLQIVPVEGKYEDVYANLLDLQAKRRSFDIYTSDNFPKRWHTKKSLLSPILVVAHPYHAFDDAHEVFKKANQMSTGRVGTVGMTGYDMDSIVINGIFIAKGPSFRRNAKVLNMDAVDVFGVISNAIQLKKIPPNNSTAVVKEILRGVSTALVALVILLIVAVLIGAAIIVYIFIPNERRANWIIWTSK